MTFSLLQAVDAINKIAAVLPAESINKYLLPMVQRLAGGDWFTSRISSAGLFATLYPRVPDPKIRQTLRFLYTNLCRDETPMVRRAACSHIGHFSVTVEPAFVKAELVAPFSKLTGDDQDSVRLLTVENCVLFAKALKPDENVCDFSTGYFLPSYFVLSALSICSTPFNVACRVRRVLSAVIQPPWYTDLFDACFVHVS